MAAKKKKKKPSKSPRLREMIAAWRERPWLLWSMAIVATFLVLLVGTYVTWQWVQQDVVVGDDYMVALDDIEITPVPPWLDGIIREETIREEVFPGMALDGPLSIMEDDLTQRMATSFALHPWIAKVDRVTKQHPGKVLIELQYRRPVAMVPTPEGAIPIDGQGIQLPRRDFSVDEAARDYLQVHLVGPNSTPLGMEGETWGDPRVTGAANIAAVLLDSWKEWGLRRIEISRRTPARAPSVPAYDLVTHGGTHILWGRPPGVDIPGEATAEEKLAWIEDYFADHGTLEGNRGPQNLEIPMVRLSSRPTRNAD